VTGLSQARVEEIRKQNLSEGEDWRVIRGVMMFATSALDKVLESVQVTIPEVARTETPAPDHGGVAPARQKDTITIVKLYPNPTWVQGKMASVKTVNVRVRNSRMMHRGQVLRDAEFDDRTGSWTWLKYVKNG